MQNIKSPFTGEITRTAFVTFGNKRGRGITIAEYMPAQLAEAGATKFFQGVVDRLSENNKIGEVNLYSFLTLPPKGTRCTVAVFYEAQDKSRGGVVTCDNQIIESWDGFFKQVSSELGEDIRILGVTIL